jgi:hypothetical protein
MVFIESVTDVVEEDGSDELQFLAWSLLSIVGVVELSLDEYKISVTKQPEFYWEEIEATVMLVIRNTIAKGEEIKLLPRDLCTDNDRRRIKKNGNRAAAGKRIFKKYPKL